MRLERLRSCRAAARSSSCCNSDIHDWRITFADTGINSNIGQRLKAVEKYLEGEEEFLANYSDGLTDLPLPQQLEHFHQQDKIASFLCVRPNLSYHLVSLEQGNGSLVSGIHAIDNGSVRINGGFFIFKKKIFEYMRDKEELVIEPFHRLVAEKQLIGYPYDGFWASMDTFKDKQQLESLYASGAAPWEVWKTNGTQARACGIRTGVACSPLNLPQDPAAPLKILCLGSPLRRHRNRLRRHHPAVAFRLLRIWKSSGWSSVPDANASGKPATARTFSWSRPSARK